MKQLAQSLGLFVMVLFTCSYACSGQNGPSPTPVPSVVLSWVQSTGPGTITMNNVYRCQGAGCVPAPPAIATITPAATTYTDKAVTPSTTYVYALTASSSAGEGAYSNTVTAAIPTTPVTPSAPSLNAPTETGKVNGPEEPLSKDGIQAKVVWK